jgi:hypothetical protein
MKLHGNTRHGHASRSGKSATWLTWASMIRRCTMPSQDSYPLYGGRGIVVCERWQTFENFLADMGEKPAGTSIERIDSDGNYEPSNCRWATMKEQQRNRRGNRHITNAGLTMTAAEWAERTGLPSSAIRSRLDKLGWPVERALTEPLMPQEESVRKAAAMSERAPIAEYVAAMQRGESCAQIGARYGITGSGVTKALQRAGIKASDYTQTTEARRARALGRMTQDRSGRNRPTSGGEGGIRTLDTV